MRMDIIETRKSTECLDGAVPPYEDPLGHDLDGDEPVQTTRRSLLRLALVAAETASHFVRDGVAQDPVAWMLAPRRLFDGRVPLEACLDRDDCLRAVLLHALSLGTDADRTLLDELMADDDVDDCACGCEAEASDGAFEGFGRASPIRSGVGDREPRPRLWTSFVVSTSATETLHAFDAVVAFDRIDAEMQILRRHGRVPSADVDLVEGFDAGRPLVEALVSPAMTDMLRQVAGDPSSLLAEGLSISIHQRFAK